MALNITSENSFIKYITTGSHKKLVVVDWTAEWCKPCKMIAPVLDHIAMKHGELVDVIKVDVDRFQELAMQYGVTSMPTIHLFLASKIVDSMTGANEQKIVSMVESQLSAVKSMLKKSEDDRIKMQREGEAIMRKSRRRGQSSTDSTVGRWLVGTLSVFAVVGIAAIYVSKRKS